MRKSLSLLRVAAFIALMAGCGETGKEADPEVTPEIKLPEGVQSSEISITSDRQSVTVAFISNVPWTATVSADWTSSVSPSSGQAGSKTVSVNVMENSADQSRTAYVTISDTEGKTKLYFIINQGAAAGELAIKPESMTFTAQGGEESLTVSSNTDWTVSKDADWITLNSDEGRGNSSLKVIVKENQELTERTGTITVTTADGKVKGTVSVKQDAADVVFSIDPQEVSVSAAGEDFSVKVTSNIGYEITYQPDWVKQTNKTNSGNTDTFTFKVEANSSSSAREGAIVFCNDKNECVPVTVKQAGADVILKVDNNSFSVVSEGGTITLKVTHNVDYTTSLPDWISQKAKTTDGDTDTLTFNISRNSGFKREGTIIFNANNSKASVSVNQDGSKKNGGNDDTSTGGEITVE